MMTTLFPASGFFFAFNRIIIIPASILIALFLCCCCSFEFSSAYWMQHPPNDLFNIVSKEKPLSKIEKAVPHFVRLTGSLGYSESV